jgi:hypothetical protein
MNTFDADGENTRDQKYFHREVVQSAEEQHPKTRWLTNFLAVGTKSRGPCEKVIIISYDSIPRGSSEG